MALVAARVAPTAQTPQGDRLSRRAYIVALVCVLTVALTFRVAFGARGTFTGDDWGFRAAMAQPLSLSALFTGHNGHLNPLGLLLQWFVQHLFPGRYVPLMVVSAMLVVASGAVAGWWFQMVFGRRWAGVVVALVVGVSPMLVETMTWWSVALYAAPLALTSWLVILITTRFGLGDCGLRWPLAAYALCLLASSKAITVPLLMLAVMAGLALRRPSPTGFRYAFVRWQRLWLGVFALTVVYAVIFAARKGPLSTADPSGPQVIGFVADLWRIAVAPAIWGGPWTWLPLGFHNAPGPVGWASTLSVWAFLLACAVMLALRPRVWRVMLMAASAVTCSALMVAWGRAGSAWGGPSMRYAVDVLLPLVLVTCSGLYATRWETNPRPAWAASLAQWRGWRVLGAAATLLWILSVSWSMLQPWRTLPNNPIKQWVANARDAYPYLGDGLLWQFAPRELSLFLDPLDTFLAGDPKRPVTTWYVIDRALGFNGKGELVSRDVNGVAAIPPATACAYSATKVTDAVVPLASPVGPGRHFLAFDYFANLPTGASVRLGDGPARTLSAPSGARRVYAVVDGGGDHLRFTVSEPNATMCILGATVGDLVDGAVTDPGTLRAD